MLNRQFFYVLRRKIYSFWQYPWFDKLMLPVVFILLGLARLGILLLPFNYYAGLLGAYNKTQVFTPVLNVAQTHKARRIGRLVRATAKITPWKSLCLVQALVASILLRRNELPYILHFGLAKDASVNAPGSMKAHAWVTAGCLAVTGGKGLYQFKVVGSYVPSYLTGVLPTEYIMGTP